MAENARMKLMRKTGRSVKNKKTAQEIQDDIFRKMPAEKKIKLSCELTGFCLKLNSLNGDNKPGKTSFSDNQNSF